MLFFSGYQSSHSQHRPKIVLFVSRIHPKKGLINLVDAWGILKKKSVCEQWKCVLAGPNEDGHLNQVMAHAKTVGVVDDFEYVGPVLGETKDKLYAEADIFVLPTFSENFGSVVIEALSQGCPVITTKGAPWAELLGGRNEDRCQKDSANERVVAGRCGWWVDIGVEPLVETLGEAMSLTDEERYQMGINGRRLAESKYTWPSVAQKMSKAYETLIKS